MKLLVSAYACAPNRGSDLGVGWNWTTEAHKLGHEIWALVSPAHRNAIAAACRENPGLNGIHWLFPEVKAWPLRQGIEPRWERTYNLLWQYSALAHARPLHRRVRFGAVHHVTWAGIRAPTFLGALKIPLIIGPIGGGETSPGPLRDELGTRGRILEKTRDLSSATIAINPVVSPGLNRACVIFVCTEDTRNLFTGALREKMVVFTPLGISALPPAHGPRTWRGPPKFLFTGRLLYWKGAHIAIRAFAEVARKIPGAGLTIVGDGHERSRLEQTAKRYDVQHSVAFISRLPQAELFELYRSHDFFLFPSLHDSGGFVVLEALSYGMPVICLDLGGPRDIVTPNSGIVVETRGRDTAEVAAAMGDEILRLCAAPSRAAALSEGAIARAADFLLPDRVKRFYEIAESRIEVERDMAANPHRAYA
ncbi:MAG: glycosyltransferase family 4 protein [Acetobacteraceae bacterium]